MNRFGQRDITMRTLTVSLFTAVAMGAALECVANDTAAEVSVGGIHFKEETRISLEREDLIISENRIEVTYRFKNLTDAAVTTAIAFPIPDYRYEFLSVRPDFADFTVEVNGAPVQYEKHVKASVKGKDYTNILTARGISISDFDGYDPEEDDQHFQKRLHADDLDLLFDRGLLGSGKDKLTGRPLWTVSLVYSWTQEFPARSETVIKHTYTPVVGYSAFRNVSKDLKEFFRGACDNQDPRNWIEESIEKERYFAALWVYYILTTANNWAGPIREFNLDILNPEKKHVLVCFDGTSTFDSLPRIEFRHQDLVPRRDIKVYYLWKLED